MQYPYDPTDMQAPTPPRTGDAQPQESCQIFEIAREAACSDPVLGRLWLNLFDDANP